MKNKYIQAVTILLSVLIFPVAVSATTLSVSPSSQTISTGSTVTVTVRLDTQGKAIDGVDLRYLRFNPSVLQVVDANPSAAGVQISPGSLMPMTILASADNSAGRVSFSQVVAGGTTYTGAGNLLTVTFRAIAPGTSAVTLDYTRGDTTDSNVAAGGQDILTAVVNASYTVTGGSVPYVPPPTYTPPVNVPVPPVKNTNLNNDPFVPLPDVTVDEVKDDSSMTFGDLIRYVLARIKSGFMRVFGK